MDERILVDTGPIVALLVGGDQHHAWAREIWEQLSPPLVTCEAVLSEAQFVIERLGGEPRFVLEFVKRGALTCDFILQAEVERLIDLQQAYQNVPMSLADAGLVRMSELNKRSRVLTTDSHFSIYRRNGRHVIPLIRP